MNYLVGKKTYIFAAIIAIATGARYLGWIDESLFQFIAGICGAGAAASLRAGSKIDAQTAAIETVAKLDECKETLK
jgi:hypothetical protein